MKTQYEELYNFTKSLDCTCVKNAKMSEYTSFKIGGFVPLLIEPCGEKSLSAIMKKCYELEITPIILGKGSNILIGDDNLDFVVIHIADGLSEMKLIDETTIECGAGALLIHLCRFAQANSLTGLEFAFGIPGSVGGALFMNAGAYGGVLKDVVASVRHVDNKGKFGTFTANELELSYRHSIYKENGYVITSIRVKLEKGSKESITDRMDDLMGRRVTKQPLDMPSAGSTFKRPQGNYASALIDECGLKGLRVGDAMVSEKHAGFVINAGNASAKDVEELIHKIQQEVFNQKGVKLDTEIIRLYSK